MAMLKIKKGDTVRVIAGEDVVKEGKVIAVENKDGRVTENWTRPGLKWSNRPGYSSNYGNVKTTGTAKKARSINLTEYARQCASGKITSYGVMLKNADETKSYGQFYSSRASSNRPKKSVTYYD